MELQHIIADADAAYPHDTADVQEAGGWRKPIDLGRGGNSGSVQIEWDNLATTGGPPTGVFTLYTSLTGRRWIPKARFVYTPATTTGEDLVNLNNVLSEQYGRLVWTPNNVAGGRLNCYLYVR